MAYNLQSLITILEHILNPQQTRWILDQDKPQTKSRRKEMVNKLEQILHPQHEPQWILVKPELQSLLEKSISLQQILEKCPLTKIESLESEIRDATHKAEDVIESHMVDQMLSNPKGVSFTFPKPKHVMLQQVMKELDSVMEQAVKLIEENMMLTGTSSSGAAFSRDLSSKSIVHKDPVQSKVVVGIDADLVKLKDRVMGMHSKLEIVPIVGMGGIGKTTLARKLYQDLAIVEHFQSLAWATVSQDYNMRAILLSLIGKERDQHTGKECHELKDILYRSLYGRRYIIVLDDVWSIKLWDDIRMYLPDNNKGSRIVITTRETQVAEHANSHSKQHEVQLLSESASWDLLRQEVFGDDEDCPGVLEKIGRNIARNCGGLPLAICVIGGLLSKDNMSEDVWEKVAYDVTAAAESDKQFSNVLSLSYNHLSAHLRPCFLYMGAFPEDYEIKASTLIRLWVAEGFMKSKGEKSLEEEEEDCLKALVDRNLVSVRSIKSDGRAKRYGMHDVMRDLCLKKVEQQRFVHVGEKSCGDVERIRRVNTRSSLLEINLFYEMQSLSLARSFLCTGPASSISYGFPSRVLSGLRLLRVLDLLQITFRVFPTELLQIVNLRYLAFAYSYGGKLPSDISRLCYLQTLVISCRFSESISFPCEILQMAELRHVVGTILFDGSDWGGFILDKLQTIYFLESCDLCHEFLHRIPNVKKLGIKETKGPSAIFDLYHLHKLEALRFGPFFGVTHISPSTLTLPLSLKKLSLTNCLIVGEFMSYLCELPNLEVLKLRRCYFKYWGDQEWDATQQEFCTLKFLLLDGLPNMVKWQADETNFPRLRHLVIRGCYTLEEIPCGIGEIPTLQIIELFGECRDSLVASAKLIIEEQRDNGNDDLQLRM